MVSMVKTQLYLDPRVGISGTWISGVQRGITFPDIDHSRGPTLRRAYGNKSWSLDHHWIVFPVSKKLLQIFGHCHKWNPSISHFSVGKRSPEFSSQSPAIPSLNDHTAGINQQWIPIVQPCNFIQLNLKGAHATSV